MFRLFPHRWVILNRDHLRHQEKQLCARKRQATSKMFAVVGIDIGKETCPLVGFDRAGQPVLRKQIRRSALVATFEDLPRCVVGMEACLSAHFVSPALRASGFETRITPAIYVKPFNNGQRNDFNDAEAIAEAALRPNLRTVSEKTQDQLNLQVLHRVRARPVSRRTATVRSFLIAAGYHCPCGSAGSAGLARTDSESTKRRDLTA